MPASMRIRVDTVELNCEVTGSGTPLVLTHGLGGSLRYWDEVVDTLAKHHRVVRWDVRGSGQSDQPAGPYSPKLFAADLAGLLDALEIERAHLLGISMGGVITQRFALDYPDRVRSLVLLSTSSEVGVQATANWQKLADRVERQGFDERSIDARRSFSATFAAAHPQIVERLGRETSANHPVAYAASARAMSDYHWTDELKGLSVPVLILQGLDDQLTPPGGAVKMSRVLPTVRLLLIPGAGHNMPLEQPLLVQNSALAFIGAVDLLHAENALRDRNPSGTF